MTNTTMHPMASAILLSVFEAFMNALGAPSVTVVTHYCGPTVEGFYQHAHTVQVGHLIITVYTYEHVLVEGASSSWAGAFDQVESFTTSTGEKFWCSWTMLERNVRAMRLAA